MTTMTDQKRKTDGAADFLSEPTIFDSEKEDVGILITAGGCPDGTCGCETCEACHPGQGQTG